MLEPGTPQGRYVIAGLLGQGGMGEVYRGRDAQLGREVAIKVLRDCESTDPNRLRRFELEARAAGRLNHPNILAIYDVGTHEGLPYLVSELLRGETIAARIARGPIAIPQLIDLAVQIARGLVAAHDHGIVHRDLKPENVFITTDGDAKILDFGLAKLSNVSNDGSMMATAATATKSGIVMGTVGYMSPEQVRAQPVDHRSDIFSFGAILFEMASG